MLALDCKLYIRHPGYSMISKKCYLLVWYFTAVLSSAALGSAKDEAAIKNTVASVGVLLDLGLFEALEKAFSEEVLFDYTSLNDGKPAIVKSRNQIAIWARILPGFDVTRHHIADIKVELNGNKATVDASVTVDHFIKRELWQIRGDYHFRLTRVNTDWQITALTFSLKDQKGNPSMFGVAVKNAAENPHPYLALESD